MNPQGMLVGHLDIVDDCLFVRGSDGTLVGLAWPGDAHWNGIRGAVELDDEEVHVGDEVWLGGGIVDIAADKIARMFWIEPPRARCLGDEFWFVGSIEPPAEFPRVPGTHGSIMREGGG